MSLIHKALRKIEQEESLNDTGSQMPEEGAIVQEKEKFLSTSLPPRTIVLMVFTALALVYAVYTNFIAPKTPRKVQQAAAVPAPAATVPQTIPEVKKPEVDIAGVSKSIVDESRSELPLEAKALKDEGEKYFLAGDFVNALVKFEEALGKAPNSPEILNSMGLALKRKGDQISAKKYYNQAIEKRPNCSECLNNLGVLEADEGDNVSAVLHLKKAIAVAAAYPDPYFNLAVIMEKEGNYKSAVEYYKKFLTYMSSDDAGLKDKVKKRIEDLVLNWEEQSDD